jgi:hypothetical protein
MVEQKIKIMSAGEKGHKCNFSFEIVEGDGIGQIHRVKAPGLVREDLLNAFSALNVHLAAIDDAFKNVNVDHIDNMRSEDVTTGYTVSSFVLTGEEEDLKVVLKGMKYISSGKGGRMALETPKIVLDETSSYKWASQLCEAIMTLREEIELYKDGKYDPVDPPKESEDENQLNVFNADKNAVIVKNAKEKADRKAVKKAAKEGAATETKTEEPNDGQ